MRVYSAVLLVIALIGSTGFAANQEYLIKMKSTATSAFEETFGGRLESVSVEGSLYKWTTENPLPEASLAGLMEHYAWTNLSAQSARNLHSAIEYVEANQKIFLTPSPSLMAKKDEILKAMGNRTMIFGNPYPDNPAYKKAAKQASGTDPLLKRAWGMTMSGAEDAWKTLNQGKDIIVAVTDTGVDYTHEDLANNMWINTKEIDGNGKDDDGNGYVDDIVGYDFAANDAKPYDLTTGTVTTLFVGGNPGHGTHVAGVVGASLNNKLGTAGVAPQVKIMALRFLSERGQGDNASAIKAIDYAVKNGANIINASWGSEKGDEDDKSLVEAIERAEKKGVIFVAAAGNGRSNSDGSHGGYDNDNDAKPAVPASYNVGNIVAVAAHDSKEELASFSNWGAKSVKIAAPGVKILSTVPGNRYQDTVLDEDIFGSILKSFVGEITWDGTSMASPFVSGALAAYWSKDPSMSWTEVRDKVLDNAKAAKGLKGKVATNGRLDLSGL